MNTLDGQSRCADGTRIVYQLHDRGAAAPRVVLVHSLAMDRRFWRPVADRLSHLASVLVYDCRGHGGSDKAAGAYTVELFAHDLAGLMDHVGWSSAIVAGASMGGCVGLAFAAAYPARVQGLGLFDTTACYGPEAPAQWAERAERALRGGLKDLVEFQTTRWFSDRFRGEHPEVVRHCVDVFLANDLPAYAQTCRMLGACDLRSRLGDIAAPTRIAVGEEDYATPVEMAEALHAGIRNSSLSVIERARHLTPLEVPERIIAELKFLLETAQAS